MHNIQVESQRQSCNFPSLILGEILVRRLIWWYLRGVRVVEQVHPQVPHVTSWGDVETGVILVSTLAMDATHPFPS